MQYKTIAVKPEVYDLIKERARVGLRPISSQIEYELLRTSD